MWYMLEVFAIMAKCRIREFMTDENGDTNIVSMVVLMGVAVLLAIVFKKQIGGLVNNLLKTISTNANDVVNNSL